jgi:hypothetical protein
VDKGEKKTAHCAPFLLMWRGSAPGFSRQQDIEQQVDDQVHDLPQKENDTDENAKRRVDQESASHECSGDCDNEEAGETVSRHNHSPVR